MLARAVGTTIRNLEGVHGLRLWSGEAASRHLLPRWLHARLDVLE